MIEWIIVGVVIVAAIAVYFLFVYQGGSFGKGIFPSYDTTGSSPNPDGSQTIVGSLQKSYSIFQSAMEGGSTPYGLATANVQGEVYGADNPFSNLLGRGPQPITSPSTLASAPQGIGVSPTKVAPSPLAISAASHPNYAQATLSPWDASLAKFKTSSFSNLT